MDRSINWGAHAFPRTAIIESNFVEEHPNLVREYEEGNDFDKEKEIKLYTNDKTGKSGSTISPSMTPAPSTTSSTGSNCVSR